jgi:hypothetical protein
MPERRELPDSEQLTKLFRMLLGPEDKRDDASAEIVLEMHGIDPATADDALRERLEREVAERRGRGEDIPQAMLDALASFASKTKSKNRINLGEKGFS